METLAFSYHQPLFRPRQYTLTATFKTIRTIKCSISPPSFVDQSVKFKEAAKHGNLIPMYRPIFSDHLTPVLAYRCLVKEDERDAPSFLFESVEPGLKASSVGRYSVIGAQPTMEIVAKENMVTIVDHHEGQRTEEFVEDPMVVPRRIMENPKLAAGSIKLYTSLFGPSLSNSTMTSEEYQKAVLQAKEHILAGDIFQIVLSQRFERRTFADPFEVYRALRIARGCILVASSPEILTRVKKVSKSGSVKVEKLMNIERYSHVMHISSTVTGELSSNLTSWDALRAALPVGTVSGAPKVKAMELIDELEVTRRGPYSGGFGGISFTGDMDIALALRTIVFPTNMRYDTMYSYKDREKRRDWVAHLQAGAGIVADSDPADEQRECENKAAALARAIDLAESSFVEKSFNSPGDESRGTYAAEGDGAPPS
ncbi:hypothetical protein DH2020_022095 [Rehmannia glutinosa]|uniref:Anthranilate synthase n=1 Tax=Rehmannia glutinosa TaxID=99300 RepID=A0ABR0WGL9_REHGL